MPPVDHTSDILGVVRQYWGFDALRPLQADAIAASLAGRDSLVVMPTGGGKSLCYQVPPLLTGKLCVVVSPLIALMKDQVDGLRLAGYPAAALHSNLSNEETAAVRQQISRGELKLLLVAPERLLTSGFLAFLAKHHDQRGLGSFAIDEAHCISQWGHDFRPEYRRLAELRNIYRDVPFHAYTATATPRVREDIVTQLQLKNPAVLVGVFDRPNLTYRVLPRVGLVDQVSDALRRHHERAAIVYCITRKDTEGLAADLKASGFNAAAYHAGLDAKVRARVQESFKSERLDVVVATVAFGMGIDRGDVRCVVHASMPKTVEHYQQETGRAGRDGLPAECVLFYSAADVVRWQQIMERGAGDSQADADSVAAGLAIQMELLEHARRLCSSARCRHQALSEYFGQAYTIKPGGCGACDVCLNEIESVDGSQEIAQKILSCVWRVGQRFGAAHVTDVLRGSRGHRILELKHDQLTTFGLLKNMQREALMSYINQLVDEGVLARTPGGMSTLYLTAESGPVLKGQREVVFFTPKETLSAGGGASVDGDTIPLTPEESELFDSLRALRREIAEGLGVPPYTVFADTTLEEMARVRPGSRESFVCIKGIGTVKLNTFGGQFLDHIRDYCERFGLGLDAVQGSRPRQAKTRDGKVRRPRPVAAKMFSEGASVEEVAAAAGVAVTTAASYLNDYILSFKPEAIDTWVSPRVYGAVADAVVKHGDEMLRPIFDELGGAVPYDQIRLVVNHRRVRAEAGSANG